MLTARTETDFGAVNMAFSSQSSHFDEDDFANDILQEWRMRIYKHVDALILPESDILELNAGTGIDSVRFAQQGHRSHATDLSDGMVSKIRGKIDSLSLHDAMTCQQVSFDQLYRVKGSYNYVFSNFGGLNCIADLAEVTRHLPALLKPGAIVTFVIMPPFCPWELSWVLKGDFKQAFRRWRKNGVMAHLEGSWFRTHYHSLSAIKEAFGTSFTYLTSEGIGVVSPPPAALSFVKSFPRITRFLNKVDRVVGKWPIFQRWGDHIIVTFAFKGA